MVNYSKEELDKIDAERKYWQKYGDLIGAVLSAWSYKTSAHFYIPSKIKGAPYTEMFSIDSNTCRMVDAAVAKEKKRKK